MKKHIIKLFGLVLAGLLIFSACFGTSVENWPDTPLDYFEFEYNAGLGGIIITSYTGPGALGIDRLDNPIIAENTEFDVLKVRIPDQIDGLPVVGITTYWEGNVMLGGFRNTNIMSVYIPDTVVYIGEFSFGRSRITGIELPEALRSIGNRAFFEALNLSEIVIPGSVTDIGERAFEGTPLTNVTLNYGLRTIGARAFQDTLITNIVIPDSVTYIGDGAFFATPGLQT